MIWRDTRYPLAIALPLALVLCGACRQETKDVCWKTRDEMSVIRHVLFSEYIIARDAGQLATLSSVIGYDGAVDCGALYAMTTNELYGVDAGTLARWRECRGYVDPWRRPYNIRVILGGETNTPWYQRSLREILIWSSGPDGRNDFSQGDDVSWPVYRKEIRGLGTTRRDVDRHF